MKITAALLMLLTAVCAFAKDSVFEFSGKKTAFSENPALHLLVSKDCEKKPGQFDCEAYRALKRASLKGIFPQGGANPGALLCGSKLDGQVVIGKNAGGAENSFCVFGDGSMISCGSLAYYGRKNDLKSVE